MEIAGTQGGAAAAAEEEQEVSPLERRNLFLSRTLPLPSHILEATDDLRFGQKQQGKPTANAGIESHRTDEEEEEAGEEEEDGSGGESLE